MSERVRVHRVRYFTLDGSDYPFHDAQENAVAGYVRRSNKHATPKRNFAPESKIRRPEYRTPCSVRRIYVSSRRCRSVPMSFPACPRCRHASIPPYGVLPVLAYDDVRAAVEWLTRVFRFAERVQIGEHRAQLSAGSGAVIVADATNGRRSPAAEDGVRQSVMIRVHDVDAHYRAAVAAGAQATSEPADYSYGERQYSVRDPAGHLWTFTESVANVAPESWGGVTVSAW